MKYAMTRQPKAVSIPAIREAAAAGELLAIGESADSIAFDCWLFLPLLGRGAVSAEQEPLMFRSTNTELCNR
jgi:hypothetical protein